MVDSTVPNVLRSMTERATQAAAWREGLLVRLAAIAGLDVDARDRWFAEAKRRQEATGMSEVGALESVYQDVIAGRMR